MAKRKQKLCANALIEKRPAQKDLEAVKAPKNKLYQ
jgi:hypothetical protein